MDDRRTVGVEEEFLLVDRAGTPRPMADLVVPAEPYGQDGAPAGIVRIEHELQQEQAETATEPRRDLAELRADLVARRRELAAAAAARGGRIAALGTCPVPVEPTPTRDPRYLRMMREYGLTAQEQLTCGCHVHVAVGSRAEGVVVLDAIRPWLPVLLAIAANSPFWQGVDTGYASYRRMVWDRWPGSGPTEPFGSVAGYDTAVAAMQRSGVLLDEGMVYFDARLSAKFPTVEFRVADVCPEAEDAVLVAALCRGLVQTAADAHRNGGARRDGGASGIRLELLRGAAWRAARSGLDGDLVDAVAGTSVPALTLVQRLVDHVTPALRRNGDLDLVTSSLHRLLERGTGASLQRTAHALRGDPADVVTDAVRRTSGSA